MAFNGQEQLEEEEEEVKVLENLEQKEEEPNIEESKSYQLSDYQILEEVGSGSFGIVRLVMRDNQKYALKELSKQRVLDVRKACPTT